MLNPCKDCITFCICKNKIEEEHRFYYGWTCYPYSHAGDILSWKCSLLKDYIEKVCSKSPAGRVSDVDLLIRKIFK